MSNKKKFNSFRDLEAIYKQDDYNKPNDFGIEGEDHINISLHSSLGVGRFLDPGYNFRFEYPMIGAFASVFSLIYWLRDDEKNDIIRNLKKREFRMLPKKTRLKKLDNHLVILLCASFIKLKKKQFFIEAIKKLPKDIKVLSYSQHKDSKLRITTGYAQLVVPVMRELISAIQEDRDVDYSKFITAGGTLEKGFLENVLVVPDVVKEEPKTIKVKPKTKKKPKVTKTPVEQYEVGVLEVPSDANPLETTSNEVSEKVEVVFESTEVKEPTIQLEGTVEIKAETVVIDTTDAVVTEDPLARVIAENSECRNFTPTNTTVE